MNSTRTLHLHAFAVAVLSILNACGSRQSANQAPETSKAESAAATVPVIPDDQLVATNALPVETSLNMKPAGIASTADRMIASGQGTFRRNTGRVPPSLRIGGILEPPGTIIMQLDVSPGKVCDLEQARAKGNTRAPALVDSNGNSHMAIGYIVERPETVEINLPSTEPIITIGEPLPRLASGDTATLKLVFRPAIGVTIVGFKVGDQMLGTCNVVTVRRQ